MLSASYEAQRQKGTRSTLPPAGGMKKIPPIPVFYRIHPIFLLSTLDI